MAPKTQQKKGGKTTAKKDSALLKADRQAQQVKVTQSLADFCNRRPSLSQKVLDYALQLEEEYKAAPENDCWPRNYYRLKQASVTYMVGVLRKCVPDWTDARWTKMRSQPPLVDGDAITATERLFYWATATAPEHPIITNRTVCSKVLEERYAAYGERLKTIVFQDNGWVNWKLCGFYTFKMSGENKVVAIRHISGKEVKAPASMSHYDDWYIEKNWDNTAAFAARPSDPTSIVLSHCFRGSSIAEPDFPELSEEEVEAHLKVIREEAQGGAGASKGVVGGAAPAAKPPHGNGRAVLPK